jgi:hypothetical protein
MTTYFNLMEIRYIFNGICDTITDTITSYHNVNSKVSIVNTSDQKTIKSGNKVIFLDKVCDIADEEEWMIEVHDGEDVYEYTFPNEEVEDVIDYVTLWFFGNSINDIAFTKIEKN